MESVGAAIKRRTNVRDRRNKRRVKKAEEKAKRAPERSKIYAPSLKFDPLLSLSLSARIKAHVSFNKLGIKRGIESNEANAEPFLILVTIYIEGHIESWLLSIRANESSRLQPWLQIVRDQTSYSFYDFTKPRLRHDLPAPPEKCGGRACRDSLLLQEYLFTCF